MAQDLGIFLRVTVVRQLQDRFDEIPASGNSLSGRALSPGLEPHAEVRFHSDRVGGSLSPTLEVRPDLGTRPAAPKSEPLTCEQLGAITTATLAVGAEYGMPYSPRIVEMLAECIPHGQLAVIPSVTHFMSYQQPDLFNDAVLGFVAQH